MKIFLFYLPIFCSLGIFQNFVQADFKIKSLRTSAEFPSSENADVESKITDLGADIIEYLRPRFSMLQLQLDKQKELLRNLDTRVDDIYLSFQVMQDKILNNNKEHLTEINKMLNQQNQVILPRLPAPAGDDKWDVLVDIKEILKSHDKHLAHFDSKLKDIKNSNQWLGDGISKNFHVLQNIDDHISSIERNVSASGITQVNMSKNLQKYYDQNEKMKTCIENKQTSACTSDVYPTDCADFNAKFCTKSTCHIYNYHFGPTPFLVSCDGKSEGGGWTVIQRRINGAVDFYRNWSEYKMGFGDINGEFFIGLDKLHALTTTLKPVELMIQLQDFNYTMVVARYNEFEVGSEEEFYKLSKVGRYSGNAGDCFSQHESFKFSTKDRDNDRNTTLHCPVTRKGAWWYDNCGWSNLNGEYSSKPFVTSGIYWCRNPHGFNYSYKYVQMSIRPRDFTFKK